MAFRRNLSYEEWRQETVSKSPRSGGVQTSVSFLPQTYGSNSRRNTSDTITDVNPELNYFSPQQPITPYYIPGQDSPREWDYPTGYNLNYIQPRMNLMRMLRSMRDSWGVLSTIISTRQDQLLTVPWTIQHINKPKQESTSVKKLKEFFKRPDGVRQYTQWARLVLDDLLVLDAPCIYFTRDRMGRPLSAERLDPVTVFPLIDDAGRMPQTIADIGDDGLAYLKRQPAFQQIIRGQPIINLDSSEVIYAPMRPRADFPIFGYPATEQIMIEAGEAINKTMYQFNFWKEGSIPDLIVSVPDGWTPRQIAMFQGHHDATYAGNQLSKSKVRFLPGGMKPFDIKNSSGESLWSARDETLIRLACYGYSVSPTPFIKQLNRSVAQSSQQSATEEGLFPLMAFWKDVIMDVIIQEKFGFDDIEAVFMPRPESDSEKREKVYDMQIKNGSRSRNEIRSERGEEPIPGGDAYLIEIGNAVIPLEAAAEGAALPVQGGSPQESTPGTNASKPGSRSTASATVETANNPQRGSARSAFGSKQKVATVIEKGLRRDLRDAENNTSGDFHSNSPAQLEAGNYKKGHIRLFGLNISIENSRGSVRGKYNSDGSVKWEVKMPTSYGYIRGTIGADGEQIDVFIGKKLKSKMVWVVDRKNVSGGEVSSFDEHKCFIGYKSLQKVMKDFIDSYDRKKDKAKLEMGVISAMSISEFKNWLRTGDLKSPIAGQVGEVVYSSGDLSKADTISLATNLVNNFPKQQKKKKKNKSESKINSNWLHLSVN